MSICDDAENRLFQRAVKGAACKDAWWAIWLDAETQNPGAMVLARRTEHVNIEDMQGNTLEESDKSSYEVYPFGGGNFGLDQISPGQPSPFRRSGGFLGWGYGRDEEGSKERKRDKGYVVIVLFENEHIGAGGKKQGDCTKGEVTVELELHLTDSSYTGFDASSGWEDVGFKFHKHPSRPGEVNAIPTMPAPPPGWDGETESTLRFEFKWGWRCAGSSELDLRYYNPAGKPGPDRADRRPSPKAR